MSTMVGILLPTCSTSQFSETKEGRGSGEARRGREYPGLSLGKLYSKLKLTLYLKNFKYHTEYYILNMENCAEQKNFGS